MKNISTITKSALLIGASSLLIGSQCNPEQSKPKDNKVCSYDVELVSNYGTKYAEFKGSRIISLRSGNNLAYVPELSFIDDKGLSHVWNGTYHISGESCE